MLLPPNKEELRNWFEHPVTQHFFDVMRSKRETLLETLAYSSLDINQTHQLVGRIAGFTDVLNSSYED